jgi:hypothetical protein
MTQNDVQLSFTGYVTNLSLKIFFRLTHSRIIERDYNTWYTQIALSLRNNGAHSVCASINGTLRGVYTACWTDAIHNKDYCGVWLSHMNWHKVHYLIMKVYKHTGNTDLLIYMHYTTEQSVFIQDLRSCNAGKKLQRLILTTLPVSSSNSIMTKLATATA